MAEPFSLSFVVLDICHEPPNFWPSQSLGFGDEYNVAIVYIASAKITLPARLA